MQWYNILNPRNWSGVDIRTGNNKIDGVYYNLLSNNHVSLAASGSIFLASNSGIKLISPSFVDTSGFRANTVLSENYGRINATGGIIPLYSGANSGLVVKLNDNTLLSTNIITYNSGENSLQFPSASEGSVLYIVPTYTANGVVINSTKKISSFNDLQLVPANTDTQGATSPSEIVMSTKLTANSGISIGPNNNLNSFSGYVLLHDGSGRPAQWKPSNFLKENYNTSLPMEGLEPVGVSWIRFPKRPIKFLDGKIAFYLDDRPWSPYPAVQNIQQIIKEFGEGFDTVQVENLGGGGIEKTHSFIKFATEDKFPFIEISPDGAKSPFVPFESVFQETTTSDPLVPGASSIRVLVVSICPGQPLAANQNGFAFSVTKGAYLPMQLSPDATNRLTCPSDTPYTFKPSTLNNISIRPNIHTSFNMLGENIDFLVYGKKTIPFNNYSGSIYNLNENYIPQGLVPTFKIDANISNSVSGSPTGVFYSRFLDREKTAPSGWGYDDKGKVCINTSGSYILASIPSGASTLSTYADLTVSGHTYSTTLTTEDIYLKPPPSSSITSKYISNALLTLDKNGKIISRVPKLNPILPTKPLNVIGSVGANSGRGNYEYSLQWDPPANDGRSKIVKYNIQFSLDEGSSWTNAQTLDKDQIGYVDRGLQYQTSCTVKGFSTPSVYFRVAAQNSVGIGPYSEQSSIFEPNSSVPKSPVSVSGQRYYISDSLSEINLSWSTSTQQGSPTFSGYVIEESKDYGNTWYYYNQPNINFITETTETLTGLTASDDYTYRISAWNSSGSSAYSYVYVSGLKLNEPDENEEEKNNNILSVWDFGVVLFTGVCST